MDQTESKRLVALHVFIANILLALSFWDFQKLSTLSPILYLAVKIAGIGIYYAIAFLIYTHRLRPSTGFNVSSFIFYLYAAFSVIYVHPLYILAFYSGFILFSLFCTSTMKRFLGIHFFGFAVTYLSISLMPDLSFVKEGVEEAAPLKAITFVFFILSLIIYWLLNRQRELIFQMDQRFVELGRQSAFLLHELKNPLGRFLLKNSDQDNRDADKVISIIDGIELLMTKAEHRSFGKFQWSDVGNHLQEEFLPVCEHYEIKFDVSGFEGEGIGHKSTLKLALNNLIKNAVEAVLSGTEKGQIKVRRYDDTLEVSNTGPVVPQENLDQFFKPFVSGKKTKSNYGIGLHLVESVVKAHKGNIKVSVEDGWTVFRITIGKLV